MLKTKKILSIVLISLLTMTLTVSSIPTASAGLFAYTLVTGLFAPRIGIPAVQGGAGSLVPQWFDGGVFAAPPACGPWAQLAFGAFSPAYLDVPQGGTYIEFLAPWIIWQDLDLDGLWDLPGLLGAAGPWEWPLVLAGIGVPAGPTLEFNTVIGPSGDGVPLVTLVIGPAGGFAPVGICEVEALIVPVAGDGIIPPFPVWPFQEFEFRKIAGSDISFEAEYKRAGPELDVWRAEVITSPDAQLIAMQSEQGHVLTDLIRTGDIEKLGGDGFTVTGDLGFHMGHIGYNIRPDQTYRIGLPGYPRSDVSFWPLSDVRFREALFRCYDQSRIVDTIYGYIVRPVQSLIPPAQGNWSNPDVPTYPYNPNGVGMAYPGAPIPGDPSDTTAATTILTNAGYVYHGTGYGDTNAYWTYPAFEPVRPDDGTRKLHHYKLWTPTYEVAPTSAQHGAMFVDDLSKIGLAASAANGYSGFEHVPHEFSAYLDMVFGDPLADPPVPGAQFDAYMVFWSLGRFPDHVYDMCHSSFDVQLYPGRYNAPGIIDTQVDALTEIIKTSLDHSEKNDAAWILQERLYDNTLDNAGLAYMQLYSRTYWNSFNPDLRGIVRSPGYGSDNSWTYMNLRWASGLEQTLPDGRTYVTWIWGEFPESFNRMYASTVYAVDLIAKTEEYFMDVNPYTHADMGSMAESWKVEETPGGPGAMNVTFYLRGDIFWQDGTPYTAWDAKWNWMFLKNNQIPRFTSIWKFIQDVDVIDDYTVTVIANETSQFLLYDFAGSAALLAPTVWRLVDGKPLATITSFAPEQNTTKPVWPSGIPGYPAGFAQEAGPWFGIGAQGFPQTQLYGVGPWIYVSYIGGVATFERSTTYFRTTDSIAAQKAAMFHAIGDVGQFPVPGPWNSPDGLIDVWDMTYLTFNFGYFWFEPPANPDDRTQPGYRNYLDINTDKIIDLADISSAAFYQGKQKEYP